MKNVFFYLLFLPLTILGQKHLAPSSSEISPILIGETLPNTQIQKIDSSFVSTHSITNKKKTVLIVYRGGWCPYCNVHLSNIASVENDIIKLGYQIIAVSPDSPSSLVKTSEKDKLKYTLYSDSKGELLTAMGITYEAPLTYKPIISKGSNNVNKNFLPVSSLFVINEDNKVVFEYIAPDYKHRISDKLLLTVLKNL
ncbi:antioxidant AhpC [Flavobacterium columnare]|uniref:thioredoxin-dependent peroxiredoxin n=1 Tax=Flavobacterium columnare TaxID=996 RepID=A0AAI8GAT8_9FLAO|nr:peroxiredoxin-like family protein [Flavobacterium columnare]AMO19782.1 AhpC/TSA family protein [Flavobacterium columnare]ANO48755.1 peroxiredoxin [Flavobacterium columnare]APT23215.1 antioxidant AhpC [Flavobacterium columnare]AUX17713.1 antioxidant AhpC [Flavobacterium columnare]MBF6652993.1 AhpC/TSA family protein [Flavobacterium columnare]